MDWRSVAALVSGGLASLAVSQMALPQEASSSPRSAYLSLLDCVHEFAVTRFEVNASATEIAVAALSTCDDKLDTLQHAYLEQTKAGLLANSAVTKLPADELTERLSRGADQFRAEAADKAKASAIRMVVDSRWVALEEQKKGSKTQKPAAPRN